MNRKAPERLYGECPVCENETEFIYSTTERAFPEVCGEAMEYNYYNCMGCQSTISQPRIRLVRREAKNVRR